MVMADFQNCRRILLKSKGRAVIQFVLFRMYTNIKSGNPCRLCMCETDTVSGYVDLYNEDVLQHTLQAIEELLNIKVIQFDSFEIHKYLLCVLIANRSPPMMVFPHTYAPDVMKQLLHLTSLKRLVSIPKQFFKTKSVVKKMNLLRTHKMYQHQATKAHPPSERTKSKTISMKRSKLRQTITINSKILKRKTRIKRQLPTKKFCITVRAIESLYHD